MDHYYHLHISKEIPRQKPPCIQNFIFVLCHGLHNVFQGKVLHALKQKHQNIQFGRIVRSFCARLPKEIGYVPSLKIYNKGGTNKM